MTRTARRRWSREFSGEIDGIVLGERGPVCIHGYDPPVAGKWIDNVIPGKLVAYDRNSGDHAWTSPCEVGYGRGFGSGLGREDDVVLIGPSLKGYRIARMTLASGELIGASEIQPFDQGIVYGDMSVTVSHDRVCGIMTDAMLEVWTHLRDEELYHWVARADADSPYAFVVYTNASTRRQGVLRLDIESGDFIDTFVPPEFAVIHELAASQGTVVLLVGDRAPSRFRQSSGPGNLRLEAFRADAPVGSEAQAMWREGVADDSPDELPDVNIAMDSGKLYVASGALLEVRDGLSGRALGDMTLPGLDERIAWKVSQGAGLLAEETRASVFELPA